MSNRLRRAAIVIVSMVWASVAAAQTPVLNPHFLEFNASADHSTNASTGEPLVTRYDLEFYNIGAPSPFQTNSLNKPTPNASGVIRIDLTTTFAALPTGTTFEARVLAVGPGGIGRSGVSNQFAFTAPCTVTLTPTGTSAGAAASTGSVSVSTGTGCAWTAVSNAAWVTISSGASGTATGTVNYAIAANTAPTARNAALTIGGQTFNISQAAGCTYAISPSSLSVTSDARTGTVSVTAGGGCAWTATSSASWITVTSGASGSGNGSVGYSIAANTTISQRIGIVTIAGQAFTVTQSGIPCTSTISPTGVSVAAASTTGNIAVTIPAGCTWTAADDASWVSITSGASGTGNGSVAYSIAANPNTTQRTATITVAGQAFGITQAGVVCSTTISPTASSPTAAGGAGTVAVAANAGSCTWTAASNAAWITITAGASGTGSGSVSYNVAANALTSSRTGTMTIAGQTMTVTQAGAPCTYAISPTVASLGPTASTNTIGVTAPAGCAWTTTENAPWISITGGGSGSGNGTVTYSVTANPTITARNATMTVAGQSFDVTQAGQTCTYTVTPAGASVGAAASTGSVGVAALGGCAWTATSADPWVTITSGASGTGGGTVGYSVAANTASSPRTATLTIGGQPFTISQAAAVCTYTATPATHSFSALGGPGTVTLTTETGCTWNATTSAPWITISGNGSGNGSGTVDFAVSENPDGLGRSGTIAIGAQIVTVSQAAATCTYTFSPASVSVGSDVATGSFSVAANNGCAWTASSSAPWLTVTTPQSGSGNGTVAYSVEANPATGQRSATISVGTGTFHVTQAAAACTYTLSSTSLSVASAASTGSISVTSITGCAWTAVSADSWITISGGATGTGNGTVSMSIAANTGSASRTGTLTIASQTVTVTQQGVACTTTISPTSVIAPDTLTTGTVTVALPTGCAWTAASNAPWITIDSGAAGNGPGAVAYTLAANPDTTVRTGSMTIGGQTFGVSQSGRSCVATFNPSSTSVEAAGGGFTVDVLIAAGCSWTASPSQAWISITSGATGTGPGTIGLAIQANTGEFVRSGTIGIGGKLFQISQAGTCTYSLSPLSVSSGGSASTSNVFLVTTTACNWTAASNDPWLSVVSGQSGTGSGTVTVGATTNNSGGPRTGTVTIAGQIFTWTQSACNYSVSPTTVSASANGVTNNAFISTASTCDWSASSDVPWITMPNGNTGTGTAWLSYTVAPNPNPAPRSGTMTIAGRTVTVNQFAAPCTFTVTPTEIEDVPKGGGTLTITVETITGCSWTVQNTLSWITDTPEQGSGNGTVTLQIAPNPLMFPRSGTIQIGGELIFIRQLNVDGLSAPANPRIVVQ